MTNKELLAAFESGDLGRTEFFELALDTDLTLDEIEQALRDTETE